MTKLTKNLGLLASLLLIGTVIAGCGKQEAAKKEKEVVVKVGVVGEVNEPWEYVQKKIAKQENIRIELVKFSDYNAPNTALDNGDIDINAFQTEIFMDNVNKESGYENTSIGYTSMNPLGIYSKSYNGLKELQTGDKVAIPNDVSNEGRALLLLQTAGLIELNPEAGLLPTVKDITKNDLDLAVTTLDSNQTARALEDVDISVINNGMAVDAGLIPTEDALFLEPVNEDSTPYYNVISVRKADVENKTYQTVVKYFQTDGTAKVIKESSKGASVPIWK